MLLRKCKFYMRMAWVAVLELVTKINSVNCTRSIYAHSTMVLGVYWSLIWNTFAHISLSLKLSDRHRSRHKLFLFLNEMRHVKRHTVVLILIQFLLIVDVISYLFIPKLNWWRMLSTMSRWLIQYLVILQLVKFRKHEFCLFKWILISLRLLRRDWLIQLKEGVLLLFYYWDAFIEESSAKCMISSEVDADRSKHSFIHYRLQIYVIFY